MDWNLPNQLTVGRIVLAGAFFVLVGLYDYGSPAAAWLLNVAFVVYIIAGITDVLDGYLARKLDLTSAFGRIADPFVDKIIICGAMVYFIGGEFIRDGVNVTGWQTWMVVVILARELLVTGMRSFSESHGIPFAASLTGKVKMFLQCVAVTWSLLCVGHWAADAGSPAWLAVGRNVSIWTATLFTGVSGLVYIKRAYHLLRLPPD